MEPRFLVDVNVGRLARWLRAMGFDTRYDPRAGDQELIEIGLREGRALLTRDTGIAQRRVATSNRLPVLLIEHDDLAGQLRQVVEVFALTGLGLPFSRCLVCNAPLLARAKSTLEGAVPSYVYRTQEEFKECPACNRVYWQGTHWERMRREIGAIVSGGAGATA